MKYKRAKHHRRSIRLPKYDYTSPGAYFITICAYQHECLFGKVVGGEMLLNRLGQLLQSRWQAIPRYFSSVNLDDFVVMPNHIHGIVVIRNHRRVKSETVCGEDVRRGEAFGCKSSDRPVNPAPNASPQQPNGTQPGSLGAIIQNFKSTTTRRINVIQQTPGNKLWQRGYYDRIIRNEVSLS